MVNYNPNNPLTLGAEWKPESSGNKQLFGAADAVGFLIDASVTETISNLYVPHYWTAGTGYAKLWAEIYNAADLGEGATETTYTIRPNEDKTRSGVIDQAAGTTNLYQKVDDANFDSSADADYLFGNGSSCNTIKQDYVGLQFDTSGIAASTRPVAIYIDIRATHVYYCPIGFCCGPSAKIAANWFYNTTDYGEIFKTGTLAGGNGDSASVTGWTNMTLGPFYYDPHNDEPWGRQAIMDLDDNTKNNIRFYLMGCYVSYIAVRVVTIPEKRIAVGGTTKASAPGTSIQTGLAMPMKAPLNDAANWSKVSGTDYICVLRRLQDPTTAGVATLYPSIPYITETGRVNPAIHGARRTTVLNGQKGNLLSVASANDARTYPFVLNVGGAYSADGQGYWALSQRFAPSTSQGVRQYLLNATNTSPYIKVKAEIGIKTATPPVAGLQVGLYRQSDNVQFGSTRTLTLAEIQATTAISSFGGYDYYNYEFDMPSGQTLAAATTYYLKFVAASATDSTNAAWSIVLLGSTSVGLTGTFPNYGGDSSAFAIDGLGNALTADYAVTISSKPSAPAGLTAVIQYDDLPSMGDTNCCDGCQRAFVHLDWTSTSLTTAFSYYEIQRLDRDGVTWVTVGFQDTEATSEWDDHEAIRGSVEYYRVRVVRTDAVTSDWSAIIQQLVPIGEGDIVWLTSNENSALSTGFVRLGGGDHKYNFLSAADVKHVQVHDRNFQVRLKPLEDRGVSFLLPMLINVGPSEPADGEGVRAFDSVRAICESDDISYVCVLTSDGERFFGSVLLPDGDRKEPQKSYVANAVFIETTSTPSQAVL